MEFMLHRLAMHQRWSSSWIVRVHVIWLNCEMTFNCLLINCLKLKIDQRISMASVITTLILLGILETTGDFTGDIEIQKKDINEDDGELRTLKIELLFLQPLEKCLACSLILSMFLRICDEVFKAMILHHHQTSWTFSKNHFPWIYFLWN